MEHVLRQIINSRPTKCVAITTVICADKVFDEELNRCRRWSVHVIGRVQFYREQLSIEAVGVNFHNEFNCNPNGLSQAWVVLKISKYLRFVSPHIKSRLCP